MARPDGALTPDPLEERLRADARRVVDAALEAVRPGPLVRSALERDPPERVAGGRLLLVAVGKAAPAMAAAAVEAVDGGIDDGVVVTTRDVPGDPPPGLRLHRGGHPLPDAGGVAGARAVRDLVGGAGSDDRVLLLLSGGASALLAYPAPGLSLDDLRRVTALLLEAGADIGETNAVRKHLEALKGGGLARAAAPAPVRALVLSDVPGDRLDVIGSGPVSPDPTTFRDALDALERRGLLDRVPATVRDHLRRGSRGEEEETPSADDPCFEGVTTEVVGSAALALEAAAAECRALGYATVVGPDDVTGEARAVGAELARRAAELARPSALLQAGETTVTVTGGGRGGRNQEVALGAVEPLAGRRGTLVFSVGTDGVDGPTDAAGAVATGTTAARGRSRGLDAADHLERNDSHAYFRALDDLVVTGPTGTNVMDLMGGLVRSSGEGEGG